MKVEFVSTGWFARIADLSEKINDLVNGREVLSFQILTDTVFNQQIYAAIVAVVPNAPA